MKKWIWGVPMIACVLVGGAWYANHRVKQAVAAQVVTLLTQPQTKKEVQAMLKSLPSAASAGASVSRQPESTNHAATPASLGGAVAGSSNGTESDARDANPSHPSSKSSVSLSGKAPSASAVVNPEEQGAPQFQNREQAIQFAMSRFSEAELAEYARLYAQRGSLTPAEKEKIKEQILSHFTPAQIAALEAALGS
ncbi:hypothetical protein SAMN04489725_102246 [Alicyclobacillus hesperidum]|uniref:Uncharacterized protein n=1 Tax=Alicyclobacillus hesperidum TaxID=89784 RepID=A0A1H2RB13_9BACL|nr:hypothetical protein [Alicyclobacillus hesperidum]SDW16663.1 hypothetical protein SAMN04489725_102246 [Alicyclobacillus hesperidum]